MKATGRYVQNAVVSLLSLVIPLDLTLCLSD
jgi:hypothetical protein